MRILPAALVLGPILALSGLAACDNTAPVGSRGAMIPSAGMSDYQRQLRAADSQRAIPYSIPPETGAPMAAPMAPLAPVAAAPLAPAPLPTTGAATATAAATPFAPAGTTARPAGVAANTFTPIPFGQRPAGAEIAPVGTTEIITVAAVPTGASGGPNVVAYALQTTHSVGTERHRRLNPIRWMRWESACRAFTSQDAAQEAFLAAGGPERDPQSLDPDGDGFACWWDPQIYRAAARAAPAQIE
jgi:hypothetical protein